jgi:dipeptidyl aminopeptidase/acylaminoacyl peptidase
LQFRVLAAAATVGVLGFVTSAQAAPPPASAYGRFPGVAAAAISPDGRRIGILSGQDDKRFVSIATIDEPNIPVLPLGAGEGLSLIWAGNDHLLLRTAFWFSPRPKEMHRFERHISITPEAKLATRLLENETYSQHFYNQPIMAAPQDGAGKIVLRGGANGGNEGTVMALWRVDPASGLGETIAKGDWTTRQFSVDATGAARVRHDYDSNRITDVEAIHLSRPGQGAALWTRFWSTKLGGRERFLGYSAPEDSVYLFLETGEIVRKRTSDGATEVVEHPSPDTSPYMLWNLDDASPIAIVSEQTSATSFKWLDADFGAIHASLSKIFKGKEISLLDWSADRNRILFNVESRTSPDAVYLYDRNRKEVSLLGEDYPELKVAPIGQGRWLSFKARDGKDIQAYLTLPPGAAPGSRPPLVVVAGEGPGVETRASFDYMVQFLASRGYAVLQPYHRGLWGFGDEFYEAGFGEWGGKMQTDLIDAVAAVSGEVDARRPCIVGHDFGGYTALTAIALQPESWRCAASIGGLSDLGLMMSKRRWFYDYESLALERLRERMGGNGKTKLSGASPARFAAKVGGPVLLIHGDQDTEVDPEQSKVMADALKAAGKPVEHIVMKDEAHYFSRGTTRTQMLQALESFLAKNLPATN